MSQQIAHWEPIKRPRRYLLIYRATEDEMLDLQLHVFKTLKERKAYFDNNRKNFWHYSMDLVSPSQARQRIAKFFDTFEELPTVFHHF